MSQKEIRAGKAFVEVSIRDKVAQGLRGAWAKLKAFAAMASTALIAVGVAAAAIGAVVTPLINLSKHFADVGSDLHDMAGRTGVAVEQLSAMKYAAEQTGASLSDVEIALKTMARNGIPVQRFEELAKTLTEISDPSERAAAAMKIFGKAGTKILPMLREWTFLKARADKLGLIFTTDEANKADELGDKFSDVAATWDRLKTKTGAAFAAPAIRTLETLTKVLVQLGEAMTTFSVAMDLAGVGFDSFTRKAGLLVGDLSEVLSVLMKAGVFFTPKEIAAVRMAGAAIGAGVSDIGGPEPGSPEFYKQAVRGLGSSFGTFSSPGSNLAGRAGKGLKTQDAISAKMLAVLEKMDIKLGSIDDGVDEIDEATFK